MDKPIIYQLIPRLWGNVSGKNVKGGTLEENGTGKFSDLDLESLEYIKWLGCSHVWLTGVIRHATKENAQGCMPSNGQFVKGRAGSPFAIVDYYDVNPYLATDPDNRMQEFQELVDRIHNVGLKVLIDFVPNHVSRDYGKVNPASGHPILGENDDKNVHWKHENDFYYYPGQALTLPTSPAEGEEPYSECPAMATGNDCFSANPNINDWYETVKINYCEAYSPTWEKMYDIVRFWADKGVDGFRSDMVELVPASFLGWLIKRTKTEFPNTIFIGEVYQKSGYFKYIREVGFDYLYDKSGLYDTLMTIVKANGEGSWMPVEAWQSAQGITSNWQVLGDLQPYMLNFLENHDEQRFASDFISGDASRCFAPLIVSLFLNRAPFMLYMGQEIGERGMEEEGFSGLDGRTSIFDWWSVSSLRKLSNIIHSGLYKKIESGSVTDDELSDSGITPEEAKLFYGYAKALRFASSDDAIRKGVVYDLCYCNNSADGFDCKRHYAFLRNHGNEVLLFVANFSSDEAKMQIKIPQHAFDWMGLASTKLLNSETQIRVNVPPYCATMFNLGQECRQD